MARKIDCAALVAALEGDARLACLPLAARMLWFVLARRMQSLSQSVLLFGSSVPKPAELAMLCAVSETEFETQLQPLLERGLLVRHDDGSLECPLLAVRDRRAEMARINGLRGGRPAKQAAPRAQTSLPLVTTGGRAAAGGETEETDFGFPSRREAKKESSQTDSFSLSEAERAKLLRIGKAAAAAAGFDASRWQGTWTMCRRWLEMGATEALILSTINRVLAKTAQQPEQMAFFHRAMCEALDKAPPFKALPTSAADVAYEADCERYSAAFERWHSGGRMGVEPTRPQRRQVAA